MEDKSLLVEGTWWKNKKTGEMGFITDVQKKKGLIIFRFSQNGHVGSFGNMEFLRDFEISPSHPKSVPESNVNNSVTVGSIWRGINGMEEYNKGRLIKVVHITGNLISWRHLANAEGCPDIELNRYGTNTTCESSFLYCFEKVQDNDDGALYRPFDHTHDSEENPNKYQMVKVIGTTTTSTFNDFKYGKIEYITVPVSGSTYSRNIEDFHYEFELISLNPAEEFCVDANDPNYSRKLIDPSEGENKMEDNGTYLKTDKNKLEDFGTGAKREDKSGKGRYDLIPGGVMQDFEDYVEKVFTRCEGVINIPTEISVSTSAYFTDWQNKNNYYKFIVNVTAWHFVRTPIDKNEITYVEFRKGFYEMRKALAKHYEAGAKVHGVDNWKKGLPIYGSERGGCFLDSMRRHTDQMLQRKTDEPHAIAALWNAFCALWTLKHKPHSAMYQNASAVKAEEANTNEDREAEYLTLPSGRKVKIDFLHARTDNDKDNAFLTALLRDKNAVDEVMKSLKSVNEAPDKIADAPTVSYSVLLANVDNCIELLSKMLVDNSSIDLKFETHEAYVNLYMICVLLKSVLCWFHDNDKGRVCIEHLISGIYDLINTNLPSVRRIFENTKAEWVEGYDEVVYAVCLGEPDKYRVLGMIDLCCRTGVKLLNDDHFCGRPISNGLLFELKEHLGKLIKE